MLERIHQLIKHEKSPPESVIELLKNTLIGTEGTLYQLMDTPEKIHLLHRPHFIYLERNGKAIGTMTLCERDLMLNQTERTSFYIRYFAFEKKFQGSATKSSGRSEFYAYFQIFFETCNLNPIAPVYAKSIYWAFIDPENVRSFNMNEKFGFETIGSFRTRSFSRVKPKQKPVERLEINDQAIVLEEIKRFYAHHNFFSPVHLFENQNYFILRVNGEIVCGIQANPVKWQIKSLPGWSGKILLKTAPYLPRIRKLINPKNYRFLATEGLFWKDGYADKVETLLEGVLALSKHHSLLILTDTRDTLIEQLPVKWGFIQKMKKDNTVKIVAKFNDYSAEEIQLIKKKPSYLSGFDMT